MDNEALKENIVADAATPVTTVEESVLPEGNITPIAAQMTEEQELAVIAPTVDAVQAMNDEIKNTPTEVIEALPEGLKEGVQIWKDASEDFSEMIIARAVAKLHNNDFSEIEKPSESEILVAGAEAAKELKDEGAAKTSIEKAVDGINSEINANTTLDLIRIYSELKNLESAADLFVEYTADKHDIEMTSATKDKIAAQVLDNGLFENSELLSALNTSRDYSSRDVEAKNAIFSDFSENDIYCDEDDISEDTLELIDEAGSFEDALEAVEDALEERGVDVNNLESPLDCAIDEGSSVKRYLASALLSPWLSPMVQQKNYNKKVFEDKTGLDYKTHKDEYKEAVKSGDPDYLHKAANAGAVAVAAGAITSPIGGVGAYIPGIYGTKLVNDAYKRYNESHPDTARIQDETPTSLSPNGDSSEKSVDCGFVDTVKAVSDAGVEYLHSNPNAAIATGAGLTVASLGAAAAIAALKRKKAKSLDGSESTEEAVAENALSNDDMIQALIEKYKMLPTVETKNFMLQDMKACGFDDSIIAMVQSQGEGNFSEGEDAPVAETPVAEYTSDAAEVPAENPAESVASDLFDSILGPSVGVADPLDGTLAPGDVAANGAEGLSIWTGLGTEDAEAPMADPSGISVKQEVAEVEAANEDAATQLATVIPGAATDDAFESLI